MFAFTHVSSERAVINSTSRSQQGRGTTHNAEWKSFSSQVNFSLSRRLETIFHSFSFAEQAFSSCYSFASRKINFHVHDEWKKEENQIQLVNGSTGEISYKKACGRNGGESVPGFELRKCLQRLFSPFFSFCLVFPPRKESLSGF